MLFTSRVPEQRFSFLVSNIVLKDSSKSVSFDLSATSCRDMKNVSMKVIDSSTRNEIHFSEKITTLQHSKNVMALESSPLKFPFETIVYLQGEMENGASFNDSFAFTIGYAVDGTLALVTAPDAPESPANRSDIVLFDKAKETKCVIDLDTVKGDSKGFNILFDFGNTHPFTGKIEKMHSFKVMVYNKGSLIIDKVMELSDSERLNLQSSSLDLRDIVIYFVAENNATFIDPQRSTVIKMADFYQPGLSDYGMFYSAGGDLWNRAFFTLDQIYLFRKNIGDTCAVWMPRIKTKYPSTDVKDNMAHWDGLWNEMVLGKVFHSYWVVAHEFGHGIMDHALSAMPMYSVIKDHDVDTYDNVSDGSHAWVEGYAEFMQVMLTGGNVQDCRPAINWKKYLDSAGKPMSTDIETPEAYNRKWLKGFNGDGSEANNDKGYLIEGVVAAFLWDLYDYNDDSGDQVSGSFTQIIKVIQDKKPKNLIDFVRGWGDLYKFSPEFARLYFYHSIGGPSMSLESLQNEKKEIPA